MIAIATVFLTVLIGTFVYVGINENSKKDRQLITIKIREHNNNNKMIKLSSQGILNILFWKKDYNIFFAIIFDINVIREQC